MWKFILAILIIVGCEEMATQYNTYTPTDPNPENVLSAIDMDTKGLIRLSLTNWSNTSKPNVAQESIVEVGGSRFKTDTVGGDVISLTDPVTTSTVVDGDVYIVINGDSASGGYGSYSFTATIPTWSDTKQGYYLTGLYDDYRAVGGCTIDSGSYTDKYVWKHLDHKIYSLDLIELSELISTEKTTTSTSYIDISPTFTGVLNVKSGDIIFVFSNFDIRSSVGRVYYQLIFNGTCSFASSFVDTAGLAFFVIQSQDSINLNLRSESTSYLETSMYRVIRITSPGTLKFKEQIKVETSGNVYVKNRQIFMKKINQ